MVRRATTADLERLTAIYNQAIASRKAVADTEPFTVEERTPWFTAHNSHRRTPVFVYEDDGVVAGYCSLSGYRPGRQALEGVAEISYFIDYGYHRRGIGSRLVAHALDAARALGYRKLIAILLSCNEGSRALLQNYGFERWGTLPDVVRFDDATMYSHDYYGLTLEEK